MRLLIHQVRLLIPQGRFQECYDLCKFFAKNGDSYYEFIDEDFHEGVTMPNLVDQDLSEPISEIKLNHESFCASAITAIYYMKYWLHLNTEKLCLINDAFLDNKDCTCVIAEFLGIKGDWWQIDITDRYVSEAVLLMNTLFYHDNCAKYFSDRLCGELEDEFKEAAYNGALIVQSIHKTGIVQGLPDIEVGQWEKTSAHSHEDFWYYADYIIEMLEFAVAELNDIAGANTMECDISRIETFHATQFIVDAMTICHNNFRS